MDDKPGCGVSILFALVCFCFGLWGGCLIATGYHRGLAVKAGVAEYACDPATGNVKFVYKAKE